MYYRKYFSGSVENANLTRNTVDISNNSNKTDYYVVSDVVCRAIKETLEDVGITCTYSSENSMLVIDGLTVQILRYSNYLYYNANGVNIGTQNTNPFSGNSYKFYIILKGDIDSILNISIGHFTGPATEINGFSIGKGKDLKDGGQIRAVSTISSSTGSNSNFYVIKNDKIFPDYKSLITFGGNITNLSSLNGNGNDVTLIECVAKPGRLKLDNCYFGNDVLSSNEFYNISGEIYYKQSNNILAKCPNEQTS